MDVGARYGLFGAFVFAVAWSIGPIAIAVLFTLLALQLAAGAVVVWHRTRLPFAASANLLSAIGFAAALFHVTKHGFAVQLNLATAIFVASAIAGPALLAIESDVHAREWSVWREHLKKSSLIDILLGRHIPRLRDNRI